MASYSIQEDGVMITVCANVTKPNLTCPVSFPFDVIFTTDDGSAGKIISNVYVVSSDDSRSNEYA